MESNWALALRALPAVHARNLPLQEYKFNSKGTMINHMKTSTIEKFPLYDTFLSGYRIFCSNKVLGTAIKRHLQLYNKNYEQVRGQRTSAIIILVHGRN
jgi:hypothetical protein